MSKNELYIGLMSGTSMDGVDAALVAINNDDCTLLAQHQHDIPSSLALKLNSLCQSSDNEISLMLEADIEVAQLFAEATLSLLNKANVAPNEIKAIGSHGQTIRHLPPKQSQLGNSLQIGQASILAKETGITTISNFRVTDMAYGGQGAPLVPAFHQQLFQSNKVNRVIVNLGGIANVTWLPADISQAVLGYDTGPANTLLNYWYQKHHIGQFDLNGQWASTGKVKQALLSKMLADPYFSLSAPKSTGRELFNQYWLQKHLKNTEFNNEDIQATLSALTAQSLAQELMKLSMAIKDNHELEVYLCGGGAHNQHLISQIRNALPKHYVIDSTQSLGLDPDWVEAVAFAWLAKRHIHGQSGNLPEVTGASKKVVLGELTPVN